MASIEERLALLEDEREIMRTLVTYGNSLDYGNEEEWIDCWLPDGVWHRAIFPEPFEGHDAIRATFRGHTHAPSTYHKHVVVDPRIRIDGDTADVESYFARLDVADDGPYIQAFGRYVDVLHRCGDGRWRFKSRRSEIDASSTRPLPGGPAD
jgi:ketosteroid isomerase-like protein